jgi:hypothetical protein
MFRGAARLRIAQATSHLVDADPRAPLVQGGTSGAEDPTMLDVDLRDARGATALATLELTDQR